MTLEDYRRLVADALSINQWNFSDKKIDDGKIRFNLTFSTDGKLHTDCNILISSDGICDIEAKMPFACPKEKCSVLCEFLTEYNYNKRYSTIRLDMTDGEIVNSYSFDLNESTTPRYILDKFLNVKDIDDEAYKKIENMCCAAISGSAKTTPKPSPEMPSSPAAPTFSSKKSKFKIDL